LRSDSAWIFGTDFFYKGLNMTRTVKQLFDLTGQTALVTGGSRGLGLQMAHALGEAGARLMLSSRKADDLQEAVAELKAAGIEADFIAADCGKEEDIRRLAQETVKKMGDEFECAWLFHLGPRSGQSVHDSKRTRSHPECSFHCRLGRQPTRDANHCLQHF
jgi:hypothetical protein